jgi:hypothetical protein
MKLKDGKVRPKDIQIHFLYFMEENVSDCPYFNNEE